MCVYVHRLVRAISLLLGQKLMFPKQCLENSLFPIEDRHYSCYVGHIAQCASQVSFS